MSRARARLTIGCCLGVLVGIGGAWAGGVRINATPSMPRGLWLVAGDGGAEVRRGDVLVLCVPDPAAVRLGRERGYIGAGPCPDGSEPLVKPAAAVPGDRVTLSPDGVVVNGAALPHSAQLAMDSAGRPLSGWPAGEYAVRPGEVWAVATHAPNSWDSRYWGPVPLSSVFGVARPLAVVQ